MLVHINENLKLEPDYLPRIEMQSFIQKLSRPLQSCVSTNLNSKNNIYHMNYLKYLEICWASHYGIVLTPDIVWYTLLSEVSGIVASQPDVYKTLFTANQSNNKQRIIVPTNKPYILPIDLVCDALMQLIPAKLADQCLMCFSTSTERSLFAQKTVFADLVSPYYDYATKSCGLSKILILGNEQDWLKIKESLTIIANKLIDLDHANKSYFTRIFYILDALLQKPNADFLKKIFWTKRCGSGSQTEIYGWWAELYKEQPTTPRFVANFATHVSNLKYTNITTNKDYVMKSGLLTSQVEGDMLVPDFGYVVYEQGE